MDKKTRFMVKIKSQMSVADAERRAKVAYAENEIKRKGESIAVRKKSAIEFIDSLNCYSNTKK